MGKFDGILICTDLDGTLLNGDYKVSEENAKAIEYFKREGGYFTFITGRMYYYAEDIYEMVKPNAPIGCGNGAAVSRQNRQSCIDTAWQGRWHPGAASMR